MKDLYEGFLGGRGKKQGKEYRRRFEECEQRVKNLRNKNNELQKQSDNEVEGDVRSAIRQQTTFIETEINQIKTMITNLSHDYTDPQSKSRIKELWNLAGKEIERNKRIMEEFVSRLSSSASYMRRDTHGIRKSKTEMQKDQQIIRALPQQVQLKSEDMISQIIMQQKMLTQRNQLLKELEEKNLAINKIMNEMGEIVGGQQRDMVNQIEGNLGYVQGNVVLVNQDLAKGIQYQKKAKKKYICLVAIIVILIIIAAGLVYYFIKK